MTERKECARARTETNNNTKQRKSSQLRGLNRGGGPGRGRGRLQRAARRGFYINDVVSTADIAQAAYAQRILLHGKRIEPCHYRFVRRALALIAEPVGRSDKGPGRPMLWRFKDDASSKDDDNSSG
jgi:hypothetical protein